MKYITKPRITIEQAPAIAELLNQRINQLNISHAALAHKSGISVSSMETLLAGHQPYKESTLENVLGALDRMEREGITPEDMNHQKKSSEKCQEWGKKIKIRREELKLTLKEVGDRIGVTHERVRQIEEGDFSPDHSKTKRSLTALLTALGYPQTNLDTLDNDTPSMPDWVEQRNQVSAAIVQRSRETGQMLQVLRRAKGLSRGAFSTKIDCNAGTITSIEHNAVNHSDEKLREVINKLRMDNTDRLKDYVAANGIEIPDMTQMRDRLRLLYMSSRILRTHWNISTGALSNYCAEKYRISENSIAALESPNHTFGKGESSPSLRTIIGLIAALHNADSQQSNRVLDAYPNIKRIAVLAKEGKTLPTYGKHFRQLLERAIDNIVDVAQEVEKEVYETVPQSENKAQRIGLDNPRNTETRSLAQALAEQSNGHKR